MPSKTISIIGPTYNERDNVLPFVKRVEATLGSLDWEVIFVDDNSGDGTASEAFQLSRDNARLRLVLRLMDRGLAKSSIQGMLSAKGDLLCVMDVDGQHDPAVILEMVARMEQEGLDIVSAARRLNEMQQGEALSPLRNSISRIGNKLCSLLLGRDLSDPLTGFFIIRRDAFLKVAPKLTDPGFKILLDILSSDKTLRHGEMPFDFAPRLAGESKLDSFVVWKFLTFFLSKATAGILSANFISFLLVGALGLVVHLCVLYVLIALAFPGRSDWRNAVGRDEQFLPERHPHVPRPSPARSGNILGLYKVPGGLIGRHRGQYLRRQCHL